MITVGGSVYEDGVIQFWGYEEGRIGYEGSPVSVT